MQRLLILLLIFSSSISANAQKRLRTDSAKITVRNFDYNTLQAFKKDKDFQYLQLSEPAKSIWERFWDWIWWHIYEVMRTKKGRTAIWAILFLTGAAAVVFFAVKATGMNKGGLFARSSGNNMSYVVSDEDINSISFDDAIKNAVADGNFRLAIRLLYLQSLKQLSDRGYIEWQKDKTNNEYVSEVAGKPWQPLFKKITYNFEYAWYGEMNVFDEDFQNIHKQFQQFNNQLQ